MKAKCMWMAGLLAGALCSPVAAAEFTLKWGEDFDAAKASAKEKGLPILASFSGDRVGAGGSRKLDREVLTQPAFRQYATNFVLFAAEYAKGKKQSDKAKRQNRDLEDKYLVQDLPTLLLLDAEGNELGRAGYLPGGAEAYVKHLKELLEKAAKDATPATEKDGKKSEKTDPNAETIKVFMDGKP